MCPALLSLTDHSHAFSLQVTFTPRAGCMVCCPDSLLQDWRSFTPDVGKWWPWLSAGSLSRTRPQTMRTTSPKITASSWDSWNPVNGWCRGMKSQPSCPNLRELWRANPAPELFVANAPEFSSSLCSVLLPSFTCRGWWWEHFPINFLQANFSFRVCYSGNLTNHTSKSWSSYRHIRRFCVLQLSRLG